MCDMDCLHCKFSDCINDSDVLTYEERKFSRVIENSVKKSREPQVDMTRYIHNRIDKEEYIKARNREYEQKRQQYKDSPKRREQKKRQYQNHREEKLAYQKSYYAEHKEEVKARQKAYYEANREEINRRRKLRREEKKVESLQVKSATNNRPK